MNDNIIGLDLTKTKIKKYNEFIIEKYNNINHNIVLPPIIEVGLDLTKQQLNDKIDLTKYENID